MFLSELIQREDRTGLTPYDCILLSPAALGLEAFPAFTYKLQMLAKA